MEGFTIIDGLVAVVIILSALLAYGRGIVREAMAIAGWIAAAVLAYLFAPQVEPLVREIPYVGEIVGDGCELSIVGAFAIVFVVALIVVSLFTPLFSTLVRRTALSGVDQGFGFLFGVLRGLVLVAIAFFVYDIVTNQELAVVDNSRSAGIFLDLAQSVQDQNPEAALVWIEQRYETLINACAAPS